ncbi:glycosyltransferase family 4 protein [Pelagicoccus mobilis]|uniref:Glycosyltransferase family 4 protein n=1 Tax=Pelagicoccus mobilis TaxID=415221 RepID=A0A934S2N2_9BACT|nr:glycosyltransferase family 4 protein [Pelagicoccus mobilis]MBK1877938.1 glycosyltransferase family 4 protein [Pelagicoccus mobilis]
MKSDVQLKESSDKAGLAEDVAEPQRSPRFLWLIRGDEGYGFRKANLGLIQQLRERSVDIGFVAIRPGVFAEEVAAAGYPLWYLERFEGDKEITKRGWRFLLGSLRLFSSAFVNRHALREAIRSFQPDWLHVSINGLLVMCGLGARWWKVPGYWHIHNTISSKLPFEMQALGYQALCRMLRVNPIANSRHTADSLGGSLCPAGVCYPGSDEDVYSLEAEFKKVSYIDLDVNPTLPSFLIAARMVPEKAQDRLVEAAIELYEAGKKFSLILVGGPLDSRYAKRVQARVLNAKVDHLIKVLGSVKDTRPYIEFADVVINSRVDAEPFGLSVVEAMLMERPVLAFELGGPSETVLDGETGWLIDTPSVEGYRKGLIRVLEDRESWNSMGKAARRVASQRFSLQATTESYLDIVGAKVPSTLGA